MLTLRKMRSALPMVAVLAVFLAMGAPAALADSLSFNLTVPNDTMSVFPPGTVFASVSLSLSGDQKTITVSVSAGSGFGIIGPGVSGAFGLSTVLSLDSLSIGNITGPFSLIPGGTNMDGFGSFSLAFQGPEGSSPASGFSFTVTKVGGGTFNSVYDLVGGNANAAVHVSGSLGGTTYTGYAGGQVPEPGTLALFGTGLLAIGGLMRRRLNK